MSPVALAALSADTPDHYASALRTLADQSGRLTSSIDADASAQTANGAHAKLIATLATLRDQERALAKSAIEERTTNHQRAFRDYMAAYVARTPTTCPDQSAPKHSSARSWAPRGSSRETRPLRMRSPDWPRRSTS